MRDALLIAVVVICSLIAVGRPVFGILAFISFSLVNPHAWAWDYARGFPFAQCLAGGTILGYALFFREPHRIPMRREAVFLGVLWAFFWLTAKFADYPDRAWVKFVHISKILLMIYLSMSLINTRERFIMLLKVFALSLGFHGLRGGIFFVATGGKYLVYGPDESFLNANNSIGLALAMNMPLLFYLSQREERKWLRRLMQLMLFFSFFAVLGTFSRGAWIGMAAAIGLMVLKGRYRVVSIAALAVLALLALPLAPERLEKRYEELVNFQQEGSAQSRIWNWRFASRVAAANPVLGAGFDYYGEAAYERYFPEFLARWPGKVWSCHSIWFTMLSEHGFPGLVLWIALILAVLASLRRLQQLARRDERFGWLLPYAKGIQIAFVAYLVVGTFLDAAYFDIFYQLIAMVVILKDLVRRELEASEQVAQAPSEPVEEPELAASAP